MKILLCHNFYRKPGGERMAVEAQAELLTSHGHQVVYLTRDNREIDGFSPWSKLTFPVTTIHSRRTEKEVRRAVRRERPDVAHVHNVFPLLSPSLYSALGDAGVPTVQTLHNYRFLCPNGLFFTRGEVCERCRAGNTIHAVRLRCYRDSRVLSALYGASIAWHRRRDTLRHVDRFLALTPFAAGKIVEGGVASADRVVVLPNFLADPVPTPAAVHQRGDHYLYLGRLSAEKGVDLAIEAIAGLPGERLLIAGDGPQTASLAEHAASVDGRRVELLGFRTGSDKLDLLRSARALVVPSRWYEGLPISVLEALAAGVPVIAAGHGGLREVLRDTGAGLLHEPGDAEDLRRCLARTSADHGLWESMVRNARQLFEARYTASGHYRDLLKIYRQIQR